VETFFALFVFSGIRGLSKKYPTLGREKKVLYLGGYNTYVTLHCERPHFTERLSISYINLAYLRQYTDYARGSTTEEAWFDSLQRHDTFFFPEVSRPAVGLPQPPFHCVSGAFSLGVKRSRLEFIHVYLVARLELVELYLHCPICLFLACTRCRQLCFTFN
jgi:hypothetical protein